MIERIFVFILGGCVGSFLNVCIWRIPQNLSVVKPRSYCPHCHAMIGWYHNIPLVSYWFLRRRCKNCGQPIAFTYFLVELITAFLFLILYVQYGFGLEFFKFGFLFSLLIVMSVIDIKYHALPETLALSGIAAGILFSAGETYVVVHDRFFFSSGTLPIIESFEGLVFGLGCMYLFKLCGDLGIRYYLKIRKKESVEGETEALGLGDVDFLGMIGVFLGIHLTVVTFFAAPFFALLYVLWALCLRKSHVLPYVPYLSAAAFFSFLWGQKVLEFCNL